MLDIFEYTDYRKFLSDLYAERKSANRAFSYRWIAQKAGIASPSFIGKIFAGETNISQQTLMRLMDAFQLAGPDAEFFELMVNYDRARTELDKSHFFQRIQALRRRYGKRDKELPGGLDTAWYVPPILTLVELGLFHGDYAALGRMLTPPITSQEARSAMEVLMIQGYVHKESSGQFLAAPRQPAVADKASSIVPESSHFESTDTIESLVETLPESVPEDLRRRIKNLHEELIRLLRLAHGTSRMPSDWA